MTSNRNDEVVLTIVSITKDDWSGLKRTVISCEGFHRAVGVEHIVVDGSSSTHEWDTALLHRIRLIRQPPHGIADAFNVGLKAANGKWVWFVNGGDAVHEGIDSTWLLQLLQSTNADVVTGSLHFDGERDPRRVPHVSYQWPLIRCWLPHPSTIVRRSKLLDGMAFDLRWKAAMDYDLWNRLLRRNVCIDVISVPFARFNASGVSENAGTRRLARREDAEIVVRYSGQYVWSVVWLGLRVARRLIKAWTYWLVARFTNR